MKRIGALAIIASLALVSTCIAGAVMAQEQKETVKIAVKKGVGKYLTDSDGNALYYSTKDSPGRSECVGTCEQLWHAYCYRTDQVQVSGGLNKGDFGTFHQKTPDTDFLTYKGRPLYKYSGDDAAGETNGHGVDGQWFLVGP